MIAASVRRGVIWLLVAVAMMAGLALALDGVPYEPIFHIRPPKNWINDPNGPYRDPVTGKIHLYMQYNPNGPLWGDIAWYHVTSDDYVKWTRPESPVAMWADKWYDKWGVYSGTMINNNHSEPIAVYTCTEPENIQRQCLASPTKADLVGKRTLDRLVKSARNVILSEDDVPGVVGLGNFRDPTEWWEDPEHPGQWLIAFVARINDAEGDNAHVVIFRTQDPTFQSGYKFSHSLYVYKYDLDVMFECPDFFKLAPTGEHYLKVSTMPSHRDYIMYGSYQLDSKLGQYVFVEDPARSFTFIDYGPLYASKTFHDPILNRRTIWGWTNDELSDDQIRANGWSGVQNMLRTVEYDSTEKKLKTQPVPEIKGLRLNKLVDVEGVPVTSTPTQIIRSNTNNTLYHEIVAKFTVSDPSIFSATATYAADGSDAPEIGVMIRANADLTQSASVSLKMPPYGPSVVPGNQQKEDWPAIKIFDGPDAANCSAECNKLRLCESYTYFSSTKSCKMYWKINPMEASADAASGLVREPLLYLSREASKSIGSTGPLSGRAPFATATPNGFELHIYVDNSVIEIFKDGGLETMTSRLYIDNGDDTTGVAVYAKNTGAATVTASVEVYTMDTIWKAPVANAAKNFTNSLYNLLDTLIDV
ncbi:putative beta-fructofuranosidase [Leptomonas pyrrhocoris]|uniref:Putative beta-fructofuranosidase n=1 Tax=Leptomonas pyrrhocoris TaxID=157538 RepID=A0A0M9FT21_LEPPY|nr:putative beta-fructofuranosidase [Leptomonas pyrrhocoris]XP_015653913.1 putative beta-fructofuranosidase [Leptomonas pyrrhocoris]XP_015653914.1 putative beta-fructofuranosidase [Leptomonas pyrrhocoris]XP_015653915.1 putative beta-fructofuranosidase [Leptomonas pyrrhocoris]XP_015653916.1 putative beta-fructofuranosidase [Leptomonas pyrrhocoris]XP_015653917.1 putative beta-fructofuranosidase [Leptomonas pyrrhocoris]XP_015653918.1 putative beta-fructofuranosidase [Leptomonas pyrrhocoris]XP_0|eukprot:XP_015653912.1 putative beta-fructofuranosidase [Leptomonas pyrrhocoris]